MTMKWLKENDKAKQGKYILYFLWPFGAWVYSLKEPRSKSTYVVFFLFSVLLLWHMAPAGVSGDYHDFLGVLDEFNSIDLTTSEFVDEVIAFFTFSDNAPKELYGDFLTWFTKLFTNNYHFFFLLAAIPVALFQLKSLRLVTSDDCFQPGFYAIVSLMLMILPRDMISVQNPRFTTGFWLFVCCALYLFNSKKIKIKYLFPLLLLPVFHSGMWLATIMVVFFLIIPKNIRVLEILAIGSIPFVFIDPEIMPSYDLGFLPSKLASWVDTYTSDEAYANLVMHEGKAGFYFVGQVISIGTKVLYIIMAVQVIRNKQTLISRENGYAFYPFFLLTFFIVNMIQFVPELGSRYYGVLRIFTFFIWYKTFHFSRPAIYNLLFVSCAWKMLFRYGYVLGGALSVNMPPDIFVTPLPYLIGKGLWW